jgi:NarL family two-component system response regulator LiaR
MLTKREEEILELLTAGKLNKEIADKLHISIDTVKKHLKNIYKKLDVRNRTEAVTHRHEPRNAETSVRKHFDKQ